MPSIYTLQNDPYSHISKLLFLSLYHSNFSPTTPSASSPDDLASVMSSLSFSRTETPLRKVYVSLGSLDYVSALVECYAHALHHYGVFKQFGSVDPSALVAVDPELGRYSGLDVYDAFFRSLCSTLTSHLLVESLISLHEKIGDREVYLPFSKLEKFTLWNIRNDPFSRVVNNIVPNAIMDVVKMPFTAQDVSILDLEYVYNCMVHSVCHHLESLQFNLIWQDKCLKRQLNGLIYAHVLKKLDPSFSFEAQNHDTRRKLAMEYFKNTPRSIELFNSPFEQQSFENFVSKHLNYHNISSGIELVDIFCFFYDMPMSQWLKGVFSRELLDVVLKYFGLRYVDPAIVQGYENNFCLAYLKYLRFKTFLLSNEYIGHAFQETILHLEGLLDPELESLALDNLRLLLKALPKYEEQCTTELVKQVGGYAGGCASIMGFFRCVGFMD